MTNILVVDDDRSILKLIKMRLETENFQVLTAPNAQSALTLTRNGVFDVALVDLRLDGWDGIELMTDLHRISPEMPIIILTAHGTINNAVKAMKKGACGYLTKPFNFRDLVNQIKNCLKTGESAGVVRHLESKQREQQDTNTIVCNSQKMKKVLRKVERAAETDSVVYIHGESGTGKELIANKLYLAGPRQNGPFVALNCAAIPETLLESELFGYERGAFTGADNHKKGLLVHAQGGTFFLDEIAEISLAMQAKLLRVLEEKTVFPLGSNKPVKFDARILTATNKNLKEEIENGNFRKDLFYRIHVIVIDLPPLRERKEDLPELAGIFLTRYAAEMQKKIIGFSPEASQKMLSYDWPGNVRELKNTIEAAVALTDQNIITDDLILPAKKIDNSGIASLKAAKKDFEKNYLIELIGFTRGNISQAAKLAGKYRADLYELLKKYQLDPDDFREK
jgi:two-component system response regulator GlrR